MTRSNVLRVALVLETSGGGSGRHVLDLANGLARQGHDVTVVWSPKRAAADFIAQLHAIAGITTVTLPMERSVGPKDYDGWRRMAALFAGQPAFDIIHAHSSKAGALVRMMPKRIAGKRIYTPHAFRTMDPHLGQPQRAIYGGIERFLARRTDTIIAVSSAECDHAIALGIPRDKLRVIVNGVDLPQTATREKARAAMGLSPDDVAIGFVGRMEPQKDPVRFVKAIAQAAGQAKSLKGVMIGDGALRHEVEAANANGAAVLLGWQDGPALMPGLDVFAMTSGYEAMPYTLIEALHSGLPIVTSAVGGAKETVAEGGNGFIVPVDAPADAFAARFADLAQDADMRARFAKRSLEMARRLTIAAMTEQTLAVYNEAMRG